ncbi:hypothetical protein J6S37_01190 [Candidatus Saccharibacteria bacterium]|nr:hypothetical protein [Candidatus Saccharibacteria bacterium]
MLKVAVFDGGYGGEFLADRIKEELPVLEVIRIIDWRNANDLLTSPKKARKIAEAALRPYLGRVDLIIFANYLLTITSLKYFEKKYKNQRFLGLSLERPSTFIKRDILILTTKAVTKTLGYHNFILGLRRKTKTLALDAWPEKIDDGILTEQEIKETLRSFSLKENIEPEEIILACSQFYDIEPNLKKLYGRNLRIYDDFDNTIRKTCKILNIRGGLGKKTN